jgi:hypothetical protein
MQMQDIQEGNKIFLRVCRRCIYEDYFKIGRAIDFQLADSGYCPICKIKRPVPYEIEVLVDKIYEKNGKTVNFRGYLQGAPQEKCEEGVK